MAKNTHIIEVKTTGANRSKKQIDGVNNSLKGMATKVAAATAVVYGLKKAMDLAFDLVRASAKVEQLGRGFDNLGKKLGFTSASLGKLRQAVNGTVDDMGLMEQANNAMMLGVVQSDEEMAQLFDTAQRLGQALGVDTKDAVNSLVTGMGRQSKLMLDNLGIMVDMATAYENFAIANHTTVEAMTDAEKKTAFNNETLRIAGELVDNLGTEVMGTAEILAQMDTAVTQMNASLGDALSPIVENIAGFFTSAARSADDFFQSITETDLETTIRRLKEAGVSAEALTGLEIINLKEQLSDVNKTIDEQKFKYQSVAEAEKDLEHIGKNVETVGEAINSGISEREEMLGRLRGLLEAEKNNTFDSAGNYQVINEVTGKIEKISYGNLQSVIATQQATLGYGTSLAGLQSELDGITLKTEQITDNAERQLDSSVKQGENIAAEIEMLQMKEELEARILELQEQLGIDGEDEDQTEIINDEAQALEDYVKARTLQMEKDAEALKLEDAFILKMREKGKMMDVLTSKEKKQKKAEEEAIKEEQEKVKTTLQGIAILSGQSKASAIADAISSTYSAANEEYRKYVKQYPAPTGTILGIAAAASAVDRGLKNVTAIRQAQYGADFVTDGPEMMMVGEGSGPERVQVTPLSDSNIDGPQAPDISLTFNRPIMVEEFVEGSIIPKIREALRLGENMGI